MKYKIYAWMVVTGYVLGIILAILLIWFAGLTLIVESAKFVFWLAGINK
jgi:succinate dehydrogenase hydrophobic anchor subunit